jgi:carboxymethylenebutenolidase
MAENFDVVVIGAGRAGYVAAIRAVEEAVKKAGVDVTFHFYPKTAHWFMETDRPEYDHKAASQAWHRTFMFLNETLR